MPQRFTEDEQRTAVEAARALIMDEGYTQNAATKAIAAGLGLASHRTIGAWAVLQGHPLPAYPSLRLQTANGQAAHREYAQEERLELSDTLFAAIERAVPSAAEDPAGLKDLAIAFAILTGKRRIEEGLPTDHRLSTEVSAQELFEAGKERVRLLRNGYAVHGGLPDGADGQA